MSTYHSIQRKTIQIDSFSLVFRLRSLIKKVLEPAATHWLVPIVRSLYSLVKPSNELFFRNHPAINGSNECGTITVINANLWHDWPRHRDIMVRLANFAQMVQAERADIVILQEVSRLKDLDADIWLADRLGMAHVYSRANGSQKSIGFEEGLVILSRFPLRNPEVRQLSQTGISLSRRIALGATVQTPCGDLQVFSAHLGISNQRNVEQIKRLESWVEETSTSTPVMIGGDFNTAEDTPQINHIQHKWVDTFRHINPEHAGVTHSIMTPWGALVKEARLDYLFLHQESSSWKVVDSRHIQPLQGISSDHMAVLTRLAPNN